MNEGPNNMSEFHRQLSFKVGLLPKSNSKETLVAGVKSLRTVSVRVGGFHDLERESFLIFTGFVVDQLVSLLVAF